MRGAATATAADRYRVPRAAATRRAGWAHPAGRAAPNAAGPSVDASNAGGAAAAAQAEAEDEEVSGAETDDLHLVDDHATFAWPGSGDGTITPRSLRVALTQLHIGPKHTLQFVSTQTPSHIECDSTPDGKEIVLTFEHPFSSISTRTPSWPGPSGAEIEPSSRRAAPLVEYAGCPLATVARATYCGDARPSRGG